MRDRDCYRCDEKKQRRWGCHENAQLPQWQEDEEVSYRCPQRPYYEDPVFYNRLLGLHRWYKNGFLPDEGTWLDQSDALLKLLGVVDRAISDGESEHREREDRKRAKAKHGG